MTQQMIPEGSRIIPMENGDLLIQYEGSLIPSLRVQPDNQVRMAILDEPVEPALAQEALRYIALHRSEGGTTN